MGAVVLDGADIGEGSIIGAGVVVTPRTKVPPCSLVLGVPGKVVRQVTPEGVQANRERAWHYVQLWREQYCSQDVRAEE